MSRRRSTVLIVLVLALAVAAAWFPLTAARLMRSPHPERVARSMPQRFRRPVAWFASRHLRCEKPDTRARAVRALQALHDFATIKRALGDPHWDVERAAAVALHAHLPDAKAAEKKTIEGALEAAAEPHAQRAKSLEAELQWTRAAAEWDKRAVLVVNPEWSQHRAALCLRRARYGVTIEDPVVKMSAVGGAGILWYVGFRLNNNLPKPVSHLRLSDINLDALEEAGPIAQAIAEEAAIAITIIRWSADNPTARSYAQQLQTTGLLKMVDDKGIYRDRKPTFDDPFDAIHELRLARGESQHICSHGVFPGEPKEGAFGQVMDLARSLSNLLACDALPVTYKTVASEPSRATAPPLAG